MNEGWNDIEGAGYATEGDGYIIEGYGNFLDLNPIRL